MYQISIVKRAVRELERIAGKQRNRLLDAIDGLSRDPRPPGCKKLRGREAWRIRVGDYRVVYEIRDDEQQVLVVKIGHRREVY